MKMSKEMNNLKCKVTKYNIIIGLFMSLIIGIFFKGTIGIVFALGIMMATFNFLLNLYSITTWLGARNFNIILSYVLRIGIVVGCIIPFINDFKLVAAYLIGFISHYIVLVYCVLQGKGSA